MRQPLFQKLDQLSTERWARRGVRRLLRAAWLSVCIWCAALGANLLWGWPLRTNLLGALALAVIGGAVLLLLRPRLSARSTARRLDRRFHLDEQLATAVEVAATNPPPGSIAARLVMESSHTAELLQRRIARRQRPPWHDLLTLAALALVALGLLIMSGVGFPDLSGSAAPLPPLTAAQDPAQQLPQEPPAPGDQSQAASPDAAGQPGQESAPGSSSTAGQSSGAGDPRTLQALADALRDQGATRAAAEALDRGDLAGAAQALRSLADQASQLSQEARDNLASRLDQAARQISGSDPGLAEQLRQSAEGLQQGGQDAAKALDELARAIEQLQTAPPELAGQNGPAGQQSQDGQQGQSGQDQGQGQGQGQDQGQGQGQDQGQGNSSGAGNGPGGEQRPAQPGSRLGVEGQPLPLESSGDGQVPAQPSEQRPATSSGPSDNAGFIQGDASSSQRVQVGADPLRVPIDERDVVQDYFQPQK
jgi:hypothetical protein